MKRALNFLLSLIMVIGIITSVPIAANAASVYDLTFELNDDAQSYSLTDCDEAASGELNIPDTYNGLPVTSIGASAFWNCAELTSIIIPDNVLSIGYSAFCYCSSLSSVEIPNNVVSIGSEAFRCCSSLSFIKIPDNVVSIRDYTFSDCNSLSSIEIPDNVVSIGEGAFYNCSSLSSLEIPDSVTSIGLSAFAKCKGLNSLTIPESVTAMGEEAFTDCSNLETVDIKAKVTVLSASSFEGCTNLSVIKLSETITTIESAPFNVWVLPFSDTAFYGDDSNWENGALYLNNILIRVKTDYADEKYVVKDGTVSVAPYAFNKCELLESVEIPETVTSIGTRGFQGCSLLKTVNVPSKVTIIEDYVFNDCYSLKEIKFSNNVTEILMGAFSDCRSLKSIIIPSSVNRIEDYAFLGCENLKDITVWGEIPELLSRYYPFGYKWVQEEQEYKKLEGINFYGKKNSSIEQYANENGFTFTELCEHSSTKWIIDKKATVNTSGSKHKECTACGVVLKTATIKQLKCNAPKITAIANKDYGVRFVWDKVSGADSYKVYRKVSGGSYEYLGKTTKTAYADKTAKSGKKYYYVVKAANEAGNSEKSASKGIIFLSAPAIKTPSSSKSGITVKWGKVTGASGYIVYRKTGSGSYERIAKVSGNSKVSYLDKSAKKGKSYSYKVVAYKSSFKSTSSAVKTIKDKY